MHSSVSFARDSSMEEQPGPIPWADPGSIPGPAMELLSNYYSLLPMLQPHILLSTQEPTTSWEYFPEKRLWATVLLDAIGIYLSAVKLPECRTGKKREERRARYWIETYSLDIEGFDWVCELLDIDGAKLRGDLMERKTQLQKGRMRRWA